MGKKKPMVRKTHAGKRHTMSLGAKRHTDTYTYAAVVENTKAVFNQVIIHCRRRGGVTSGVIGAQVAEHDRNIRRSDISAAYFGFSSSA